MDVRQPIAGWQQPEIAKFRQPGDNSNSAYRLSARGAEPSTMRHLGWIWDDQPISKTLMVAFAMIYQQSFYELDYVQAGVRSGPLSVAWWSAGPGWLCTIALFLFARLTLLWRRERAQAANAVERGLAALAGRP